MRVKICGITREEDALGAAELGADAIGFIFWPGSARFIDPHRARRIAAALPPLVTTVGVFVNQPAEYVNRVAKTAGLGAVQLHGEESPEYGRAIVRPVMKAVSIGARFDPSSVDAWDGRTLVLLDVHDPAARGGTGRTIDWTAAAAVARRRRIVLAGGLTPENVGDAIRIVQPYGVDVSSGVEVSPGIKDPGRLRALFDAIGDHAHHQSAARP